MKLSVEDLAQVILNYDPGPDFCPFCEAELGSHAAECPFMVAAKVFRDGLKPSDFLNLPVGSKLRESHDILFAQMVEITALNIMTILARTGNDWRLLQWDEFRSELDKHGNYPPGTRKFFNYAVAHTQSAEAAKQFCPVWAKVGEGG